MTSASAPFSSTLVGVTSRPSTTNMVACASHASPSITRSTCSVARLCWLPTMMPARYTARNPLPPMRLVKANTSSPPETIISAYSPSARFRRPTSLASILPPSQPSSRPKPSCRTSIHRNDSTPDRSGCIIRPISAVTRKTAIGSLAPDSISNVACTRSFRRTPLLRSRLNTAPASVEPTIAAIRMPNFQSDPR